MTAPALSREEATAQGYSPITTAFRGSEESLLDEVLAGLRDVQTRLVAVQNGIEIWRLESEIIKA